MLPQFMIRIKSQLICRSTARQLVSIRTLRESSAFDRVTVLKSSIIWVVGAR